MSAKPYSSKDSYIAGPLGRPTADSTVQYRPVLSGRERALLAAIIAASSIIGLGFLAWLATAGTVGLYAHGLPSRLSWIGLLLILIAEMIRLVQGATIWLFASNAKDPLPVLPEEGKRVAVLTTIVPGKEPLDVMERTLAAMTQIKYYGQVDVWILDEGNDPEVKAIAARLGVRHFSRKGKPQYNQPSGEFKAKTKAGNHNAWRALHEHEYDYVANVDTDQVPHANFLMRTLGYFRDPDVGFVVSPQAYGNTESKIAKAANAQAYIFHGIIQRGGNGLDAPLFVGTNHVYRTSTWHQIGGYQESITEDLLTGMRVHSTVNPSTGKPWKGVATPDILAVGEGPTSWTDYLNQQKRWAYGNWEIAIKHSKRLLAPMSLKRNLSYLGLQFFYPSLALQFLLGSTVTLMYVLLGANPLAVPTLIWAPLWLATLAGQIGLFLWLRRFNLVEHERRDWCLDAMGLALLTLPVYTAAAIGAVLRRRLGFSVTAKGDLATTDTMSAFSHHLVWIGVLAGLVTYGLLNHVGRGNQFDWAALMAAALSVPVVRHLAIRSSEITFSRPRQAAMRALALFQ